MPTALTKTFIFISMGQTFQIPHATVQTVPKRQDTTGNAMSLYIATHSTTLLIKVQMNVKLWNPMEVTVTQKL